MNDHQSPCPHKASPALRTALLCLALLFLASGCTPIPIPPASEAQQAPQKPENLEEMYRLMVGTGALPEMLPVPDDLIFSSYGISPEWFGEAVFMVAQDPMRTDEVILLKAENETAAEQIRLRLNARLAEKETDALNQDTAQYAIVLNAKLLQEGLDFALLVSPEAEQLAQLYEENR